MRHFYATQVKSIGQGTILSSDGKTLKCIGSVPMREGDVVYTDGNVVYGHSPIKASGAVFKSPENLVAFNAHYVSWRIFREPDAGGYTKMDKLRQNVNMLRYNFWRCRNWLFTYKNKFYYDDSTISPPGVGDYIDIWCSKNAVYTAEFTGDDAPLFGKNYIGWRGRRQRDVYSIAINMYFTENEQLDSQGNRTFDQHYVDNAGIVYGNPTINLKRNGSIIKTFALGDYQFALDFLKEIYLQYDEPPTEDYKRYHWDGDMESDGYSEHITQDIWVSYTFTQLLNFAFTGDNGEWEMILLSMVEGSCSPHTIDEELNRVDDVWENVYSFYSFSCPVIYFIVKVKSDGTKTILQQRIAINKIENNGVQNPVWCNAKSYPVEDVSIVDEPYFVINFGDCYLTTNLRNIGKIVDNRGHEIMADEDLMTFERLCTSNPNGLRIVGALNQFTVYSLWTNYSYNVEGTAPFFGIDSSTSYAPIMQLEGNDVIVTYAKNSASMIERLSFYKFDDGAYLVCIRNNMLWHVDKKVNAIGMYPINANLDMARIRRQEDCLDMSDLIDAITGA